MAKYIYWFRELSKESLSIAGGKGANLGEMFNHGFPIPEGFVLSSDAYFDFIRANKIDAVIQSSCGNLDVQDTQKLEKAADTVKKAIMLAAMPNDIRADIIKAYNGLCGGALIPTTEEEVYVAVRSSATAEDLPEASFAGQQETYLNQKGSDQVVEAVKKCWASLFGARAIYYRQEQHFDHLKVGLAAVVQRMVQAEKAGVMFSADPVTNDLNKIVIEGAFGLGEAVVSGAVTPDRYVVDKDSMTISNTYISYQEKAIVKTPNGDQWLELPEELREKQKLSESEIKQLATHGMHIEEHYGFPQDMEWAIEGPKVYIVQSRAITTLKKDGKKFTQQAMSGSRSTQGSSSSAEMQTQNATKQTPETVSKPSVSTTGAAPMSSHDSASASSTVNDDPMENVKEISPDQAKILLQGMGASPGIAAGPVKIITNPKEMYKIMEGDVLVTMMTTPDFVPAMKRAKAIITDEGGSTCHAAIVSRELGVPCVVGTRNATAVLKDLQVVTVDAKRGVIYEGKVRFEEEGPRTAEGKVAAAVVEASPLTTGTKIYVNLAEPESAERVSHLNVDGVGLLRAEFMIANFGKHPKALLKQGRGEEFVDAIAKGLRKFCAAFYPRPVIYRATDFKTNEYRNLEGGQEFEPKEENPMIGYRGCFRYNKDPEVFNLELEAIKRVRDQYGLKNLWVMIPVVRTVSEFKKVKKLVEDSGLTPGYDFKLGIMCEVPSNVIQAEEFCKAGAQFFSIGSNDLTQLTLGIDRDNPIVAESFDERDPAILRSIKHVIDTCHKYDVKVGICGQAPSVYREFAEKLVEYGIDSISVNPDVIDVTRRVVSSAETRVLLDQLRHLKHQTAPPGPEWT